MTRTTELVHAARPASAPARRWPWALAATLAGAAAGAAVAFVVRRGQDGPGAVDPEQLRAVVDRPDDVEDGPPV